jgi:hypothetical protein
MGGPCDRMVVALQLTPSLSVLALGFFSLSVTLLAVLKYDMTSDQAAWKAVSVHLNIVCPHCS